MCQPLKENSFFGMLVAVAYITKLKKERKKKELTLRVCHKHNNGLMLPMASSKFKSTTIKKYHIFHEILPRK
jgi:hypothetical protein